MQMTNAMWGVVNEPDGTTSLQVRLQDVDFAGKTGTAQTESFALQARLGKHLKENGWFVGLRAAPQSGDCRCGAGAGGGVGQLCRADRARCSEGLLRQEGGTLPARSLLKRRPRKRGMRKRRPMRWLRRRRSWRQTIQARELPQPRRRLNRSRRRARRCSRNPRPAATGALGLNPKNHHYMREKRGIRDYDWVLLGIVAAICSLG